MSCCCAAGFTPCSGVSKYVGVNYTSNNWSSLTQGYNGLTKQEIANKFPNFCHDIKSFPKDGSTDYVAIAGGDYGCRLITIDNTKAWSDVGLIKGSSSNTSSDTWKTASIWGFMNSEFNIGDSYGTRYGWDGFTGVYGIDFFKSLGKTFLLLVCGKNGIDLYNIDDENYIFKGLKANSDTSYKKVLYHDGKIFVGTAGYNVVNQPLGFSGSPQAQPHYPELTSSPPEPFSNDGVLAYKLNLSEDSTTGNINGSLTNLTSLSFGVGGVNDIIFNKVDKKIYFSYSSHEDNRKSTSDVNYSYGNDSLVLSGGVKRFDPVGNEDPLTGAFTGFTLEDYHSDPVGQLSQVFDGSVIGARLKIDRVVPWFKVKRDQWPIDHTAVKYNTNYGLTWFSDYFENLYTICYSWDVNAEQPDCVEPCFSDLGCNNTSIADPRCDNKYTYTKPDGTIGTVGDYTTVKYADSESLIPIKKSDFSSKPVKELSSCFFDRPDADNPRIDLLRRNHFGSGITGISVCSSGEDKDDLDDPTSPIRPDSEIILFSFVLSHWQTGFTIIDVYKDWTYKERQQVSSMDTQSHIGGRYDIDWPYGPFPDSVDSLYRYHHNLHRNFPSSISCGRSTSTRFGPVISITVENIFGDMGPCHYGLHTILTPNNHCQQLMFNHSNDYNRLRGIII